MNKNTAILGIIVALAVGGIIGYASAGYQYSAQLDKAKAAFPIQPPMSFVSGTVKSISGNTITIQTAPSLNPFETLPTVRQVTVTSGTKLMKIESKDPVVFQQEMDAFQKSSLKSATDGATTTPAVANVLTPPTPIFETEINLSDIKVGDSVTIDAGEDVKNLSSFDAVKISDNGSAAVIPSNAAPILNTPVIVSPPAGAGAAPVVNTPPVRTDGGVAPVVNTPPLPKK